MSLKSLNYDLIFYSQLQVRSFMSFFSKIFQFKTSKSQLLNRWLDEYQKILCERGLKPKTLEIKGYLIKVIRTNIGAKKIHQVNTFDIARLIKIYTDQDKNPTEPIKCPRVKVKRSRMTFDEFKLIAAEAEKMEEYKYIKNAMLTALVTAQRRSDITQMQKLNIKRNYLFIRQYKTGNKIALPLKLQCDKISISLKDIVESNTNNYLVTKNGHPINPDSITRDFAKIRDRVFDRGYWKDKSPTTFHEIRSLAERLYREQKIDTMILLGHKSQAMTDRYNDTRGREYKYLKIT